MFEQAIKELNLEKVQKGVSITQYTLQEAKKSQLDAFATINATALKKNYDMWKKELPNVQVYYAIKCNPHPTIVKVMRSLGACFDCASPAEVKKALAVGAQNDEIIYANPQKTSQSIKEAYSLGVTSFTFDSEAELLKMIENTPSNQQGKFVLRLLPPDESKSICKFGVKFGANVFEAQRLTRLCFELKKKHQNFTLHGVSFHVGSGCFSTESFKLAVEYCGIVADLAKELGQPLELLDLGGGYMTADSEKHYTEEGHSAHNIKSLSFEEIASTLRDSLKTVVPKFAQNVKIIAEPGRFFGGDCMTLAIRVFGRRVLFDYSGTTPDQVAKEPLLEQQLIEKRKISEIKYYAGDGMYGWFNSIVFDHVFPYLKYYRGSEEIHDKKYVSHIFGPTCDSMDCIIKEKEIPLLQIDDWIVAEAFGAYTWAASTEFNGIPLVHVKGVYQEE